jgi:endoglucanase
MDHLHLAPASGVGRCLARVSSPSSAGDPTPGYLQVNGTKVVDPSGNTVILRGTNLGGWLVFEDWMCGITDQTGNNDREPQVTLESRFGLPQTKALIDIWQNNWITSADFDNMKSLGFNLLRIPCTTAPSNGATTRTSPSRSPSPASIGRLPRQSREGCTWY